MYELQMSFVFGTLKQEEVKNAERAIEMMGASLLQLCSGMFILPIFILSQTIALHPGNWGTV